MDKVFQEHITANFTWRNDTFVDFVRYIKVFFFENHFEYQRQPGSVCSLHHPVSQPSGIST